MKQHKTRRLFTDSQLLFLTLVCLLISNTVCAATVVIQKQSQMYPLGLNLEYLEDKTGNLSIDDVSSEKSNKRFRVSNDKVLSFGYTSSAYWLRFSVHNPFLVKKRLFLELAHPFMKHIEVHISRPDGTTQKFLAGLAVQPANKSVQHRNHIFDIAFLPRSKTQVYMRLENAGPMGLPLTLWEPDRLYSKSDLEQLYLGVFYGIILVLLIYNVFIYTSLGDKNYLFYNLHLLALLLYQLNVDGIGYQYIWSKSNWLSVNSSIVGWNLIIAFYSLFAKSFLDLKLYTPRLNWAISVIIGLTLINTVASQFGDIFLIIKSTAILQLAATLLTILAAIICIFRRKRSAYFYFGAMLFFLAGTSVNLLMHSGDLPAVFVTNWGIHIGTAAEMLLLSIGLADRINTLRMERYKALCNQEIAERQRLVAEKANEAKSDFLAKMSHELRSPLQSVMGYTYLGIARIKTINKEKIVEYLQIINTSTLRLLDLIDDLLDLSKLEANKVDYHMQFEKISLITEAVIKESFAVARKRDINVNLQPPEFEDSTWFDVDKVGQVIRNIIGNAIKFSDDGGKIDVELKTEDSQITCSVTDYGLGVPEDELEKIFNKFYQASKTKSGVKGTGLGLAISKEIIRDHQGKIWAEQNPDGGIIVSFQLPKLIEAPN